MFHPDLANTAAGAVAQPSRKRIVAALAVCPDGATAFELADIIGLHHNAIRSHLAILARSGVVWSERERNTGRPGRPRIRYRLADPRQVAEEGARRELIDLLLRLVERAHVSEVEVEAIGVEEGRLLANQGAGLVEVFRRMGFAPDDVTDAGGHERGEVDVRFRHCPFADAVSGANGAAVCALHRGVARGVLAPGGGDLMEFVPGDPLQGQCRVVARIGEAQAD